MSTKDLLADTAFGSSGSGADPVQGLQAEDVPEKYQQTKLEKANPMQLMVGKDIMAFD